MSGNDEDRTPPQSSDGERGVHVSRDAPGVEETGGRKRSKLGFHVQAHRRAKGDDPVFDNIESGSPPEIVARTDEIVPSDTVDADAQTEDTIDAEATPKPKEEPPTSALTRVMRFFFRESSKR